MPGGKRPGAGRKPGPAWHGRTPRTKAIRTLAKERVREVLTTANDPLAVLIEIANDPAVEVTVRVQAAIGAAPFMFPRLSAAVVATAPVSAKEDHAELIERLTARFAKLVRPATPVVMIENGSEVVP